MIDLVLYLFIYSFIGWCVEVTVIAIAEHRFTNRGVLSLPLCLSYGIIMDLLIILTREKTSHGFIMFGICLVVISATEFLAGFIAKRLFHRQLWDYMNLSLFGARWQGLLISVLLAFCFFTFLKIVHPFVYTFIHVLPRSLRNGISMALLILLALDVITVIPAFLKVKNKLGRFIYRHIWKRLDRAYPNSVAADGESPEEGQSGREGAESSVVSAAAGDRIGTEGTVTGKADTDGIPVMLAANGGSADDGSTDSNAKAGKSRKKTEVFARGICFDKLVWVFMIYGLAGNLIETLVVRYQTGIWMRRASLVFIPVSIVWGFGGVLFMIMLSHMARKEDRYVFVGGFLVGGSFEYLCSVFTETFMGTKFWDYSNMPFNFNGRTNLLFCFLWGFVALVWLKAVYPVINRTIERVPPVIGKAFTMVLVILLVMDAVISGSVMLRCSRRRTNPEAHNFLERYIDENYPDEVVLRHWRNIRFDGKLLVNEEAEDLPEDEQNNR